MVCPECGSVRVFKDGLRVLSDGSETQRFLCHDCGHRFSFGHTLLKAKLSKEGISQQNNPCKEIELLAA